MPLAYWAPKKADERIRTADPFITRSARGTCVGAGGQSNRLGRGRLHRALEGCVSERVELRAERLGALRAATAEDLALANACVTAGRELRARQYRAAETYLALAIPVGEELSRLPADDFARALLAYHVSGWAWLPDDEDDS